MDFGLAFSFVFKDPDWFKKVAIAAVIGLIPLIGQIIVLGWALNITKRVMNHDPNPLPDVDFGADLQRGFYGFVIGFVYALPITVLSGMLSIFDAVVANSSGNNTAVAIVTIVSSCFGLFSFLYGIAIAFVIPASYTNYLSKNSLGAGFALGEIFQQVWSHLGAYFIVVLGTLVAGLIVPFGLIACIIGVLLTYAYSMTVMGHLYGQAHNEVFKETVPAPVV